ncbi:aspartate/glutamate racemase family protein [Phaeovulum sp.]|uniref:aspartate/glutamate racemase family protein n=1 Tax=Phaeovulum sp. TaxID=2934796 RepID=UPI00272FA162|nr:amino acid racemase [Phaeovulum sp.]MDP1668412.1 amino acid racemase [Phaeovulum sp.]MDZ4120093.1 amino acid racemase [Phaeovulum sp.]
MTVKRLKLGIVGGLGARAGADILGKLVQFTPVRSESDHREILFEQKPLSEPLPVDSPDYNPTHRKFYVFDTLLRMERNGCDAALLPCFITHTFLGELRAELSLELISICEALADHVGRHHPAARRIGVLTTPYTRRQGLFERTFGHPARILYPGAREEAAMLTAIYGAGGFKAGGSSEAIAANVISAVQFLVDQGADLIVPGMTEIPLILSATEHGVPIPILNVNEIYARYALSRTSARRLPVFKVGVLGGVGPAATVDFLRKFVDATGAERDQDHIKLIVEQNPQIPDRTENLTGRGPDPTLALYSTCKKLERGGAQLIAIPCNTAHAYVDRIQRHLDIPIINILTETARHIAALAPRVERVAILATDGTIASGLYQGALEAEGLTPLTPDPEAQGAVMEAVYGKAGVKAGFVSGTCSQNLVFAIERVARAGAQVVILGCTELPLIELPERLGEATRLIDPTVVLARACVAASRAATD